MMTSMSFRRRQREARARGTRLDRGLVAGCCWLSLLTAMSGCGDSTAADSASMRATGARPEQRPSPRLRVQVEPVRLARLGTGGRVTGTVRAFHRAMLTAETQGRVVARVVEPGTRIEEGGVIVEVESTRAKLELRRAEAALAAARTVKRHAERERERGDRLNHERAISKQRLDDLQLALDRAADEVALALVARDTAQRNLADTRISAPFSGDVDSVSVNVGDFVTMGTKVATLVDLSRVRIQGGVTAREAARLKPGSSARVSFADLGGAVFEATLESVGRVAGENDGTYSIELWMDDSERIMRDGLVAQIELSEPDETPKLLSRRAALLRRDGHPEVFVIEGYGDQATAHPRLVRTGRSEGEWIEILDGLEEGERVVWDGHFALADGVSVVVDGERDDS